MQKPSSKNRILFRLSSLLLMAEVSLIFLIPQSVLAADRSGGAWMISANAGVYQSKDETNGTVNQDLSVTSFDGTLGYLFASGLYLGGLYGSSTTKEEGAATDPQMNHSGGTIGFHVGNLFVHAHYIATAEIKKVTATAERLDGSGTQFDVGYIFNLSGPFFVGVQLTSRNLEFETLKTSGVEVESEHKVSELYPSIRLTFLF